MLSTILLLSLLLGVLCQLDQDNKIGDYIGGSRNSSCGRLHNVSKNTKCACLQTFYKGNKCKFSDKIKKPYGGKCQKGKAQYCCNYMYRLAEKRNCPNFPY